MSSENKHKTELKELSDRLALLPASQRTQFVLEHTLEGSWLRHQALQLVETNQGNLDLISTGGGVDLTDELSHPSVIGPYEVLEHIGMGSMGSVYLARKTDADFERRVAIKVVHDLADIEGLLEAIREERRVLAKLRHPHIAQMYDGGETADGAPYLVMEYIGGAPLYEHMQDGVLAATERLQCFEDVCSAIAYMHQEGVAHGDISLSNVLLDEHQTAKLIDFGISRGLPQVTRRATPEEMRRKDIVDLGRLLGALTDGIKLPRSHDLKLIMARTLKDEKQAYASASDLLADFQAYRNGQSLKGQASAQRVLRWSERRWRPIAVSLIFVLGLGSMSMALSAANKQSWQVRSDTDERLEKARGLAETIIADANDFSVETENLPKSRAKALSDSLMALEQLDSHGGDAELDLLVARGYGRLASVTGVGGRANLGEREKADEILQRAWAILETVPPSTNHTDLYRSVRLELLLISADSERYLQNSDKQAEALAREGLTIFDNIDEPEKIDRIHQAIAGVIIAHSNFYGPDWEGGIAAGQDSVEQLEALREEFPEDDRIPMELSQAYLMLAQVMAWKAYYAEESRQPSLSWYEKGLALARQNAEAGGFERTRALALALLKRANTVCYIEDASRVTGGLADLQEAEVTVAGLLRLDPLNAYDHEILTNIILQRADCAFRIEKFDMALTDAARAVERQRETLLRDPDSLGRLYRVIATERVLRWIQEGAGEAEAACQTAARIGTEWTRYEELSDEPRTQAMEETYQENMAVLESC